MRKIGVAVAAAGLLLGGLAAPAAGDQEQDQRQSCAVIAPFDSGPCPNSEQSEQQEGSGTSNQEQAQEQHQCFLCISP